MRITGGEFSGRVIKAPTGLKTRPTSDRVRAAMFNILAHHNWGLKRETLQDAIVLDAFAGSGALGLEALSWGAATATFWDHDRNALKIIEDNVTSLGLKPRSQIFAADALQPRPATDAADLIFLDPPYRQDFVSKSLAALHAKGWIAPDALIVAETAKAESLNLPDEFSLLLTRVYGDTAVHFLRHA